MKRIILLPILTITLLGKAQNKIEATGNVGIGTTDPKVLLHVSGNINSVLSSTKDDKHFQYRWNPAGDQAYVWSAGNALKFGTATGFNSDNWNEKIRICDNGNVGIGIPKPDGKIHTKGGIAIQNPQLGYDSRGDAGERAGIIFGPNNSVNNSMFWISPDATNGNRIHIGSGFRYSDNGLLTIMNSGNVGIGTTTPKARLDVAGTIRATEIKVEAQTADFVFEPGYQLRDLSEVESFIKTNKHLPEIPSADAMEESGVNLAEMNKLLLMKIEELTLYAIDKEKRVEELEKREKVMGEEINTIKLMLEQVLSKKNKISEE